MVDEQEQQHVRNTTGLALGRGKRPKLGHKRLTVSLSPQQIARLESLAAAYGCEYVGKPWVAGLLQKIGDNELLVVPAPPAVRAPEGSS
ncbi:hypothetical protein [Gloeobacter morelensis]|uniref:hypothetical protein n=1 Tax=Gloeobacter morelensis TaxID=2907343 RepID=UPI001E4C0A1B|nr:hypothetical protein [Gloeobacter morelensis]UFP97286.1 hypothetical protein ISF26_24505 [Gloeobacter morelensis MG652769]